MSTDIGRGPRICPACGKENPPTAARCWLCFNTLGWGAIQEAPTTTPGAQVSVADSGPARRTAAPLTGCAAVAAGIGVAILTIISAGIAFVAVCFPIGLVGATQIESPHPVPGLMLLLPLGILAGLVAAYFVGRWVARRFSRGGHGR